MTRMNDKMNEVLSSAHHSLLKYLSTFVSVRFTASSTWVLVPSTTIRKSQEVQIKSSTTRSVWPRGSRSTIFWDVKRRRWWRKVGPVWKGTTSGFKNMKKVKWWWLSMVNYCNLITDWIRRVIGILNVYWVRYLLLGDQTSWIYWKGYSPMNHHIDL